jgi:hypothetical protein
MIQEKDVIDKYVLLLIEYTQLVNTSDIIKTLENPDLFVYGLNALIHVFKLSVHITKSVDTTVSYCQKGMYCYLEYIEQLHKSNLVNNLDCSDAIAFVYSKTIGDIFGSQTNAQSTTISNVLSLNNNYETDEHTDMTLHSLLLRLERITTVILWTNNPDITYTQRADLIQKYLVKYLYLMVETEQYVEFLNAVLFISSVQEHIWLVYEDYVDIMDEFVKWMKKAAKYKNASAFSKEHVRSKLLYIVVYFKDRTLVEIMDLEGWKKKNDIVKWFFTL